MSIQNGGGAQRVEVIGDCTLILGDCMAVLENDFKVDAVITDPPYGIQDIVGEYGRGKRTIANDRNLDVCLSALSAAHRRLVNGWMAVFYSCRVAPDFMAGTKELGYYGEIIWDKKAPGMGAGLRYQHENVALYKVGDAARLKPCFSVMQHYRDASEHPHQKPLELMKRLVDVVGATTVLDPFMGSGSTGVACVKLGAKFVGIELDPAHFDTACRRIASAYKEPDLFVAKEATQASIFDAMPAADVPQDGSHG